MQNPNGRVSGMQSVVAVDGEDEYENELCNGNGEEEEEEDEDDESQ